MSRHLADVMKLAQRKLGPSARYHYSIVRNADGSKTCSAEVFTSARAGANVPDAEKTQRVVGTAPFVATFVDENQQVRRDAGQADAIDALAAELEKLPDATASVANTTPAELRIEPAPGKAG
jgi:hypothetical protein